MRMTRPMSGLRLSAAAAIGADGHQDLRAALSARAGTPNAVVPHLDRHATPMGRAKVTVDLGANNADIYLARVDWSPDGKHALRPAPETATQKQTRPAQASIPPDRRSRPSLFTETARKGSWINLSNAYKFLALADGSLIWWSERDGLRPPLSLCRQPLDPADQVAIGSSPGNAVGVDRGASGKVVTFNATRDDVTERTERLYGPRPRPPRRHHPA